MSTASTLTSSSQSMASNGNGSGVSLNAKVSAKVSICESNSSEGIRDIDSNFFEGPS